MEPTHQPKATEKLAAFWRHPDTELQFAALEIALRSGIHLQQNHPDQYQLVRYLRQHENELNQHFSAIYGWHIARGGSQREPYYFLAPAPGMATRVPPAYRQDFGPEYVIVALLLCKVSQLDFQITEFESAEDLLQQLQDEYEDYRIGLFRHLAHVKNELETLPTEEKVISWLRRCFKEFKKLGWLYEHPDGRLEIMPSLDRIREMYQVEIDTLDARYQLPSSTSTN